MPRKPPKDPVAEWRALPSRVRKHVLGLSGLTGDAESEEGFGTDEMAHAFRVAARVLAHIAKGGRRAR